MLPWFWDVSFTNSLTQSINIYGVSFALDKGLGLVTLKWTHTDSSVKDLTVQGANDCSTRYFKIAIMCKKYISYKKKIHISLSGKVSH